MKWAIQGEHTPESIINKDERLKTPRVGAFELQKSSSWENNWQGVCLLLFAFTMVMSGTCVVSYCILVAMRFIAVTTLNSPTVIRLSNYTLPSLLMQFLRHLKLFFNSLLLQ